MQNKPVAISGVGEAAPDRLRGRTEACSSVAANLADSTVPLVDPNRSCAVKERRELGPEKARLCVADLCEPWGWPVDSDIDA